MKKFIIFAHARSGSTSLTRSLNLHPKLNIAEEVFHSQYGKWHPDEKTYVELIDDISSFEEILHKIFSKYDGIKVLDYQLPEEIYTHMLLLPQYKVIMLRRRNILKAIVSGLIANQTNVWHISDLNTQTKELYRNLQPLSKDTILEKMRYGIECREYYRNVIHQRPKDQRLMIDYEDLYTDDLKKNRLALQKVFKFLGLDIPEVADIDYYLDPKRAKINNEKTYGLLPNIMEINKRFGSDEWGWLF